MTINVQDYIKRKTESIGGGTTPPAPMDSAPNEQALTPAEISDRARAQGMGRAAQSASAAAGVAGQQQQQAQAGAMANASAAAARPASAPPPIQPAPPPAAPATPFSSTAGDNVKAYLDKKSGTLGQDPGAISEAGNLYSDRVTNGLQTPDASSVNAQNTQDTAASRRAYLARVQSEEAIGQSGFSAGTAQADRIRSNSQAGVDEANQAGQNSVNAYVRQRTEDNMSRAQGLETQQYNRNRDNLGDAQGQDLQEYGRSEKATDRGIQAAATAYARGRDTVADTRYDQTYADSRTDKTTDNAHWDTLNQQQQAQLAVENKAVADGKDDAAKRNLLAGLPEGPAKNAVMAGLADGSLTTATALAKVMNPDGSIKDEYRGKTPGALGMDAEKEYAEQTVDLQDPTLKTSNPQEYLKRVNAEILAKRKAETSPITNETKAVEKTTLEEKIRNSETLTPEELESAKKSGAIPEYTAANIPTAEKGRDLVGKPVNIGGKVYTYDSGAKQWTGTSTFGGKTHTDYAVLKDSAGNKVYAFNGAIYDGPPVSYRSSDRTPPKKIS